jgi:hypothetical protein
VEQLALFSGYLAVLVIVAAGLIPMGVRLRLGRRAAPDSGITRTHVAFGSAAAVCTFLHTLMALPALGDPAATSGGSMALIPAAFAFLVVVSHAGVGLQLKDTRLKDRPNKRRIHLATALLIVASVAVHVVLLRKARGG